MIDDINFGLKATLEVAVGVGHEERRRASEVAFYPTYVTSVFFPALEMCFSEILQFVSI